MKLVKTVVKVLIAFITIFGIGIAVNVYVDYGGRFVGNKANSEGLLTYKFKPLDASLPHGATELSIIL